MRRGKNQRRIALPLSSLFIVLSIALALFWMGWARWVGEMIRLMAATFMPVLVLSIIGVILAWRLRKEAKRRADGA